MAQRRLPNGRFAKVTVLPDKLGPGKKSGTGFVYINTQGLSKSKADLKRLDAQIAKTVLDDPEQRAAQIQQRLRLFAAIAYNKAATGRVSRGIFAKVQKVGTADGKGIQTGIVVSVVNYREVRFLTNLGGEGYFRHFPVQPYRIFAKGAEGLDDLRNPATGIRSKTSSRKAIGVALGTEGVGRLKVPRGSAFFTSGRDQGRGGGEKRVINDMFGPADFSRHPTMPNLTKDPKGAFFFYPLWVNHPGFPADVISDVALQEGSSFTTEVTDKVLLATSQLAAGRVGVTGEGAVEGAILPESDVVVSGIIPLPGTEVIRAAESTYISMARRTSERATSSIYVVDETGKRIR